LDISNITYKALGILFLFLAKCKYILQGYSTPRTFTNTEYDTATKYDIQVVENWLSYLSNYNNAANIEKMNCLELGPGADLGVGLYLLSKGVNKYNSFDKNDLVTTVSYQFYTYFFNFLQERDNQVDIDFLCRQLEKMSNNKNDKLNYVVSEDFNLLSKFEKKSIDFVFSQAAFEHFEDIDQTIKQLSEVVKPGAIMIALVDLKTHSRWIKDKDPNNIYRYSENFYNLFHFPGSPNRIRPYQYKAILHKHGWKNIQIAPKEILSPDKLSKTIFLLDCNYRDVKNQMNYLSITICATKI
jgi:ubiquinone/menaquinone biosynthesis C-methylase UbiE